MTFSRFSWNLLFSRVFGESEFHTSIPANFNNSSSGNIIINNNKQQQQRSGAGWRNLATTSCIPRLSLSLLTTTPSSNPSIHLNLSLSFYPSRSSTAFFFLQLWPPSFFSLLPYPLSFSPYFFLP
ncbi:hypothetical protein E2C01_035550 [Portunus trituberculatus]|uniref:Uncharacterized protein n=1 Tax=Portunus trituberculatus TaxID=210409 RepID=A0A5B7F9M8_PORTR|nr:hypothetical protein [Portunus trituberculatus]